MKRILFTFPLYLYLLALEPLHVELHAGYLPQPQGNTIK